MQAAPLDGGTDNGFTFTSPNWATQPPDEVFTITSTYPAHPAGSFNYPHLARLPTLAVYSLTKLREYSLQQEYELGDGPKEPEAVPLTQEKLEKKFQYNILKTETDTAKDKVDNDVIEFVPVKEEKLSNKIPIVSNDISPQAISSPQYSLKKKKINFVGSKPTKGFRSFSSLSGYHASTSPENFFKKKYASEHLNKAEKKIFQDLKSVPKSELYRQIMNSYLGNDIKKRRRRKKKFRNKKKGRHHKSKVRLAGKQFILSSISETRDCKVSSWSGWGECSKTCGIGETIRTREIEQHPAHGGRPCQPLREFKWCGSARNCNKGYFNW